MAIQLAKYLKATTVIFGCDVDGVFTSDPRTDRDATLVRHLKFSKVSNQIAKVGGSRATDVTGGMRGKLIESTKLANEQTAVIIMNLARRGNLTRLLKGEEIDCTRIIA
jgi:glutamate 5-kinase